MITLDLTTSSQRQTKNNACKHGSSLVAFEAGQKVPIKLEYVKSGWGSQDRWRESVSEEIGESGPCAIFPELYNDLMIETFEVREGAFP